MGGLLYNTYVSLKGKRFVWIFTVMTVLFIAIRMIFPGWRNVTSYISYDLEGNQLNEWDRIIALFPLFMIAIALEFTNMWVPQCIEKDEKNKIREYFSSMPFGKNTYVASKFAYIGIVTYVFFSFSMIWTSTAGAFSIDPTAIGMADMMQGIEMVLFALSLFSSGLELCMFLVLGTKKAMMIKVGFFLALGIAVIGFLLFGNILVFEKINLEAIMNWINTHQFEVVLIQILSSASGLLIYFGFYKLTCALYNSKK